MLVCITGETGFIGSAVVQRHLQLADQLVIEAAAQRRIDSVALLRPTIVLGAGMPNRSIAQMIAVNQRGPFFFIGRRGASANYVHVSSVAAALVLCGRARYASDRIQQELGYVPRVKIDDGLAELVVHEAGR